ncbi:hypothetical protein DPMN_148582 [Dreissena polymorpha]|uniref:Uncharacterized protein n=1 Tax=Dreissena polymorpha TaxID=45954 RepID=A0A9D4J4H6_DREPO|nr:hypothetical protein DPMN_148582 [Dreissena polymorpha]
MICIKHSIFSSSCVKEPECEVKWWQNTSGKSECMVSIDDAPSGPPNMAMTCSFCCTKDTCNEFAKPSDPYAYYIGKSLPKIP